MSTPTSTKSEWNILAANAVGASHRATGRPGQDALRYAPTDHGIDQPLAVAVADEVVQLSVVAAAELLEQDVDPPPGLTSWAEYLVRPKAVPYHRTVAAGWDEMVADAAEQRATQAEVTLKAGSTS